MSEPNRTPSGGPRTGPGSTSQPDSDEPVTGRAEPGPPPPAANQATALPADPDRPAPAPLDRPRTAPERDPKRPSIAAPGKPDGQVDTRT